MKHITFRLLKVKDATLHALEDFQVTDMAGSTSWNVVLRLGHHAWRPLKLLSAYHINYQRQQCAERIKLAKPVTL
jgi:hypothetical protein